MTRSICNCGAQSGNNHGPHDAACSVYGGTTIRYTISIWRNARCINDANPCRNQPSAEAAISYLYGCLLGDSADAHSADICRVEISEGDEVLSDETILVWSRDEHGDIRNMTDEDWRALAQSA